MRPWDQYASDVVEGRIVAGKHVISACKRYQRDRQDERFDFRESEVDKCVNFISLLTHFSGKHNNAKFTLMPWQSFIVANLSGFYWRGTNRRRFTFAYISMARKQGKTALMAALMLYFLLGSGEANATVLLAANSLQQVSRVDFPMVDGFLRKMDPKGKLTKRYRNQVKGLGKMTGNNLYCVSSDTSRLDGFDVSAALIDEYHEAVDDSMKKVLRSGQGNRENPFLGICTTRGFDDSETSPCKQEDDFAIRILDNEITNDEEFAIIYALDEEDQMEDEGCWVKAMPNLGITVSEDFIRGEVLKAKDFPSELANVEVKYLNRWHHDTVGVWIGGLSVEAVTQHLDWEFFRGKEVSISLDLSSNSDLCSISVIANFEGTYYCKWINYVPSDALLTSNENWFRYKQFAKKENLRILQDSNVIDYDVIMEDILKLEKLTTYISTIYYDKWNSTYLITKLTDMGFNCRPISQSLGSLNIGCKETERRILENKGKIVLDDDSCAKWCFSNCRIRDDIHGNISLAKDSAGQKIDCVMALVTNVTGVVMESEGNFVGI